MSPTLENMRSLKVSDESVHISLGFDISINTWVNTGSVQRNNHKATVHSHVVSLCEKLSRIASMNPTRIIYCVSRFHDWKRPYYTSGFWLIYFSMVNYSLRLTRGSKNKINVYRSIPISTWLSSEELFFLHQVSMTMCVLKWRIVSHFHAWSHAGKKKKVQCIANAKQPWLLVDVRSSGIKFSLSTPSLGFSFSWLQMFSSSVYILPQIPHLPQLTCLYTW